MVRHLVDYVAIVELIADDTHDLDLDDDTRPRGKWKMFLLTDQCYKFIKRKPCLIVCHFLIKTAHKLLQKEVVFRGVCSNGFPKRTGKDLHSLKMA